MLWEIFSDIKIWNCLESIERIVMFDLMHDFPIIHSSSYRHCIVCEMNGQSVGAYIFIIFYMCIFNAEPLFKFRSGDYPWWFVLKCLLYREGKKNPKLSSCKSWLYLQVRKKKKKKMENKKGMMPEGEEARRELSVYLYRWWNIMKHTTAGERASRYVLLL